MLKSINFIIITILLLAGSAQALTSTSITVAVKPPVGSQITDLSGFEVSVVDEYNNSVTTATNSNGETSPIGLISGILKIKVCKIERTSDGQKPCYYGYKVINSGDYPSGSTVSILLNQMCDCNINSCVCCSCGLDGEEPEMVPLTPRMPQASSLETGEESKLAFSEDFSNCGEIIYKQEVELQELYCKDGRLHLVIQEEGDNIFAIVPKDIIFTDFSMEVEATQESSSNDNVYGILFRFLDKENFYRFNISGNGYYSFDKVLNGVWKDIVPLTRSTAILRGKATNRIKVECEGNKFTFYVNGVKLGGYTDSSFASGKVCLIAGTHPGTHISFDNLNVLSLSPKVSSEPSSLEQPKESGAQYRETAGTSSPTGAEFQIMDHALSKAVENGEPVDRTNIFSPMDEKICCWVLFGPVRGAHQVQMKWYSSDGQVYATDSLAKPMVTDDPKSEGYASYDGVFAFEWITIKRVVPEKKLGNWHVDIYIDGQYVFSESFTIKEESSDSKAFEGVTEIRGQPTDLNVAEFTWDFTNFAGFYYDLDNNLGTERLTFRLSEVSSDRSNSKLSDQTDAGGMRGVVYTTSAQTKNFKYKPWGSHYVIGFLGEGCFAGYFNDQKTPDQDETPFYESTDTNMLAKGQISKVLIDDDIERTMVLNDPLKLAQGYELVITKWIGRGGKNVNLELVKDGQIVDAKVISPSKQGATYYYTRDFGDVRDLVAIAVHFKNAFNKTDPECIICSTDPATVDGIWQISDTSISVKAGEEYDKMTIEKVDPASMTITMGNKDSVITLKRSKDMYLMDRIRLRTADQQEISPVNPLKYYIYKSVVCGE